jgi:cytochrome c oxidase subunit II
MAARQVGAIWLAVAATGCSRGVQSVLDPAGEQAAQSELMMQILLVVCGIMYLLVMVFLVWALWRARSAGLDAEALPANGQTAAEPRLERGLTAWSALIVIGLLFLTTATFVVDRRLAQAAPDPLKIKVTAKQWWWQIEYEGAQPDQRLATANELHLPRDRPALIELASNDVIHSFWVPNLSGKEDLIPGRTNTLIVTPRRTGRFRGQCAEFCGEQHAKMAFDVLVEEPAAFEAWRARQLSPAQDPQAVEAGLGKQVFMAKACVMCHRISGTDAGGVTGPDLTHLASRPTIAAGTLPNRRGQLQAWIADPQGIKPGTAMPRVGLTSDELTSVVAYLETLT